MGYETTSKPIDVESLVKAREIERRERKYLDGYDKEIYTNELIYAICKGSYSNIESILKEKPELIYEKTKAGETCLHVLARISAQSPRDRQETIKIMNLIALPEFIEAIDNTGSTPLLLCVQEHSSSLIMISILLDIGANVKATDNEGKTLLHKLVIAIQFYNISFVDDLLEKGLDINAIDNNGNTALHAFVNDNSIRRYSNYEGIIKRLVSNGADINRVNSSGETALLKPTYIAVRSYKYMI